jgi:hypothetical protein
MGGGATLENQSSVQEACIKKCDRHHVDVMSSRDAIMLPSLVVGRVAKTTPRCLEVFTVTNNKNLQWNYEMDCNVKEIGGQIVV